MNTWEQSVRELGQGVLSLNHPSGWVPSAIIPKVHFLFSVIEMYDSNRRVELCYIHLLSIVTIF